MSEQRLEIAIQKSGRLAEMSLGLLKKCGISLEKSKDQLLCKSQNFPLDVLLVRDDDIPAFVSMDVCQLGIVGQNVLVEKQATAQNGKLENIIQVLELGFGKCRLSLAAPNECACDDLSFFNNKTIATSYRGILGQYLKEKGLSSEIVTMRGAVEIAPKTHMADAICDLVSTGGTLASNGLKEIETIFQSQAVLVKNAEIPDALMDIYTRLLLRIKAVLRAENSRYIMLHSPVAALEEIKALLPGSDAPTILPLQGYEDKVALHAVCDEEIFWNTMEELKAKGASSILVLPIEKILD